MRRRCHSLALVALACSLAVTRGLRMQREEADDELDEEDLAELDAAAIDDEDYGEDDLLDDLDYGDYGDFFDPYGGDDLAELLGQEVDGIDAAPRVDWPRSTPDVRAEEMLEALFNGEGGLAELLESLGLEVELEGDDDDDAEGVSVTFVPSEEDEDGGAGDEEPEEAYADAEL